MPGSSLLADWTQPPKHGATELVEHLIKLIGADVCTLRKNIQGSYRFVDTARNLCDSINDLITRVTESEDDPEVWNAFERYSEAIDPLEETLQGFVPEEDLDDDHYLYNSSSIDACLLHIRRWGTSRSHVREQLRLLRTQDKLSILLNSTAEDEKDIEAAHQHDDRAFLNDLVTATKSYLSNKDSTGTFSRTIQAMLHEVSKGIQTIEAMISETERAQSIDDKSTGLAIKGVMTLYGFMELSLNQTLPSTTRVYLKSQEVWLPAKQLLDSIIGHIKKEKTYDEVDKLYQEFLNRISRTGEVGLPSSYSALLKLVGKIGRSYHAQSILLATLCREAATYYKDLPEKTDQQYVALENALDRTLETLQGTVEVMKSGTGEAGSPQSMEFNLGDYDTQPCTLSFKDSAKELTSCFEKLGVKGPETGEQRLEKAKENDKKRMKAANERFKKVKPTAVDRSRRINVTVKIREGKFNGIDIGQRTIPVRPSTRLSAIGWSVSMDPALKDKLKGRKLLLEQELSGAQNTTKPATMDVTVGSLAGTNTNFTLYAVVSTPASR